MSAGAPAGVYATGAAKRRVLLASLIGTTIEFFDFYIYATAAVLVFPHLFFPPGDPTTATLQSFATFALAFIARPFGSALFGHFGDRVGRKATLVAALLTMGVSTVLIGLLPTYAQQSRTPTLILHGEADPRVPVMQSHMFYRYLKLAGQAPVRLVLYPGEGHGNARAASRYDYSLRLMQWMDHYLKGPGGEPPPYELEYALPAAGAAK